jgi:hypothetical protein
MAVEHHPFSCNTPDDGYRSAELVEEEYVVLSVFEGYKEVEGQVQLGEVGEEDMESAVED